MEKVIFDRFRAIVYEKSGISLNDGKEALVSARVAKRMRALGYTDHRKYLEHVSNDVSGAEVVHLIDAISTNVTSFFREPVHFDLLTELVKQWLEEGQTRFRIWSAASSTGEEPYTIAMTMLEATRGARVDIRILATDISTAVLEKCRQGTYSSEKVASVPPALRERYFTENRGAGTYTVKNSVRDLITFRRLNLSHPPFPMKGPFDVVLCRNVMIYFDNTVRGHLLQEVHRLLKPGGYLMVGHAESLTGILTSLKVVRPSVYVKR